jgi:hypothetical protein
MLPFPPLLPVGLSQLAPLAPRPEAWSKLEQPGWLPEGAQRSETQRSQDTVKAVGRVRRDWVLHQTDDGEQSGRLVSWVGCST